ncbi:hypothetical protein GALMADRAFT_241699 [Galerina marginata CBS 339.88]|uniref:F-box domain-containing protein n=1 Tax=Galerina marginata (strain CBS 339.88) TaxID=685588 RepID=A0A067TD67_GALM3|nr:hypothetical protein GALMADRAFT_241699 [Galerina marginata CBS 339.88]
MPDPNPLAMAICTHTDNRSHGILNLDNDVLWYIFSINAKMDEISELLTPALLTLWYTSQVCSRWRQVAITSPEMWARVLNLNLFIQTTTNWADEVIRRTGTALMHVSASFNRYQRQSQLKEGFLVEFLNAHWSRIRSLDVKCHEAGLRGEETWKHLFERQAPSLEILIMRSIPGYRITLTSNIAPLLHTLSVEGTELNFRTLRMPTLRKLYIWEPVFGLDLLNALSHLPFLEVLVLQMHGEERGPLQGALDPRNPLPIVTLPHLTSVYFVGDDYCVNFSMSFLAQITPAKGCVLHYAGIYHDNKVPDYKIASSILSKYLQHYTACNPITKAKILGQNFTFNHPSSAYFLFKLGRNWGGEDKNGRLLAALSTIELGGLKILTLFLSRGLAPSRPGVIKFVRSLVSVEELRTNLFTLNYLQDILLSRRKFVLPVLKIIDLECSGESDNLEIVTKFINTRIKTKFPPDNLILRFLYSDELEKAREGYKAHFPGVTVTYAQSR